MERIITYNGESHNLKEWGKLLNMDEKSIAWRIKHWSLDKALTHKKIWPNRKYNDKEKYCAQCKKYLPLGLFGNSKKYKSGRDSYCRKCKSEYSFSPRYMHRYGINKEQKQQMIIEQNNKCALCSRVMDRACIDHNHTTGSVRGLLCVKCNAMLGHIEINNIKIEGIIEYLNRVRFVPNRRKRLPPLVEKGDWL